MKIFRSDDIDPCHIKEGLARLVYLSLARLRAEAGTEVRMHHIEHVQPEFLVVVHKVLAVAVHIAIGHNARTFGVWGGSLLGCGLVW